MESNDPFAAPADVDISADPFATDPLATEEPTDLPGLPEPQAEAALPIVDREGEPVAPDPVAVPDVVTEAQYPPAEVAVEAPVQPTVDAPAQAPVEVPVVAETPAAPPEAAQEPQTGAQESDPTPPVATEPVEGEVSAPGTGPGPRGGKGEIRHYKVLYQTSTTGWEDHPLDKPIEGVKIHTDKEGVRWMEARNNDHATRLAYAVLGSPADGVTVWPVPVGAYKPKTVKPKPVQPERTRLEIS